MKRIKQKIPALPTPNLRMDASYPPMANPQPAWMGSQSAPAYANVQSPMQFQIPAQ